MVSNTPQTDCAFVSHGDGTLCICTHCGAIRPIAYVSFKRNCDFPRKAPPEPRPQAEQDVLVTVCRTCPSFGDTREHYQVAPVCQLDAPAAGEKEPCRKKAMCAAYIKRWKFRGGECERWLIALTPPVR